MIIANLLAILIGLSLGVMGGGGSILTVPILVYVIGMDPKDSIALSLAIVGSTSLIGSFGHYKKGNINLRIASVFGPIAMGGTFIGAKLAKFMSGSTQMIIFAVIMLIASIFMFKGRKDNEDIQEVEKLNYPLVIIQGLFVGIVTGTVGVGGGFLIVPALVLMAGLRMKKAVGTSLLIISLNSFSGFLGYIDQVEVPWPFLLTFILFTGIGIAIGNKLVDYVSGQKLKIGFAVFLIIMGSFILYKNKDKFKSETSYYQINKQSIARAYHLKIRKF